MADTVGGERWSHHAGCHCVVNGSSRNSASNPMEDIPSQVMFSSMRVSKIVFTSLYLWANRILSTWSIWWVIRSNTLLDFLLICKWLIKQTWWFERRESETDDSRWVMSSQDVPLRGRHEPTHPAQVLNQARDSVSWQEHVCTCQGVHRGVSWEVSVCSGTPLHHHYNKATKHFS